MKEEYQKMQEQILPDREKQDEIWDCIEERAKERRKKWNGWHKVRLAGGIGLSAAILICVLYIPQTGFAENIESFLKQYYDDSAKIQHDIVKNVYEDSDGHIKMQVTKMMSDGACVYMDLCYEALDDKGKEWLSNKDFHFGTQIEFPYEGDILGKTAGFSQHWEEYEDMATEQARYFSFLYEDFTGNFNLNTIKRIFTYPMCEREGRQQIKVDSTMDVFVYRLEGQSSPSKFYVPQYLFVSKLSYAIFGKDQGVYHTEDGEINEEFFDQDQYRIKASFIMKDGSEIEQDNMSGFHEAGDVGITEFDLIVGVDAFTFQDENDIEKYFTIDPENLSGLKINDTYYDLVPETVDK